MLKFINKKIFVGSFFMGLILMLFFEREKDKVLVYPTLDNIKDIEYIDRNNLCYEYRADIVECPMDSSKIKKIPIQN